ncbi:Conserved_hypothetical protein [Hexamita inflata]|uniref:Uncharacterized protein n=1 Tax=Hexamita inflata TaxID=28002 RepID=A0AA86RE89_9EUKA|nr:Conserved hypothetical protein [Hexamita inflata]
MKKQQNEKKSQDPRPLGFNEKTLEVLDTKIVVQKTLTNPFYSKTVKEMFETQLVNQLVEDESFGDLPQVQPTKPTKNVLVDNIKNFNQKLKHMLKQFDKLEARFETLLDNIQILTANQQLQHNELQTVDQ